jgi:hypothetical protein
MWGRKCELLVELASASAHLVSLVLPHEGEQFLGSPAFSLEIIVIRSRCTSVHLDNISTPRIPRWSLDVVNLP